MSTATTDEFLTWARSQLGVKEKPVNLTPYAACAHHPNGEAWCSTFLCCGAKTVGLDLPLFSASCQAMVDAWKRIGRFGSVPSVGAFGYIWFPSKNRYAHTFVVEAVHSPTTFTTIEGNTDVKGGRTGGQVMRHDRTTHLIGFGYPVYAKPSPALNPPPLTHSHATPVLKPGSTGAAVKDLQGHLNAWRKRRSLSLMPEDGIYGSTTAICMSTFEKAYNLPVNGVCNRADWVKVHTITKGATI